MTIIMMIIIIVETKQIGELVLPLSVFLFWTKNARNHSLRNSFYFIVCLFVACMGLNIGISTQRCKH